jgi:hypothetical protein
MCLELPEKVRADAHGKRDYEHYVRRAPVVMNLEVGIPRSLL